MPEATQIEAARVEAARVEAATSLFELSAVDDQPTSILTQTEPPPTNSAQTQTDLSSQLFSKYQDECQLLRNEKSRLEKVIHSMLLTEESLRSEDDLMMLKLNFTLASHRPKF